MKLSKERAKELCTKSQYGEIRWWERLLLFYYLIFFKECSDFTEKNTKLTSLCEKANLKAISEKDKSAMKEKLKNI